MSPNKCKIEYDDLALSDLEKIHPRHRTQIIRKIGRLEHGLHGDIKRLNQADAAYRLRAGDYRVLFDVAGDVIVVRRIGNRRDIYD